MNKDDFHIPFLQGLVIIAAFTLVSMGIAHYFIHEHFHPIIHSGTFTSSIFHSTTDNQD
jgi:hypothetical protein